MPRWRDTCCLAAAMCDRGRLHAALRCARGSAKRRGAAASAGRATTRTGGIDEKCVWLVISTFHGVVWEYRHVSPHLCQTWVSRVGRIFFRNVER